MEMSDKMEGGRHEPPEKNIMIYGAGQAGAMAAAWLPKNCRLVAYIDGDPARQGDRIDGIPVISPQAAFRNMAGQPDCPDSIYLCVINKEAACQIRTEIENAGFRGEVIDIPALQQTADIRLAFLRLTAREIKERGIEGDLAELGVYRGDFSKEMNALFPDRELFLFDTFEGFDERDLTVEKEKAGDGKNARASVGDFGDTSIEIVKEKLPYPEKAIFIKGYFPESLGRDLQMCGEERTEVCPEQMTEAGSDQISERCPENRKYCIVSLDTDLYEPTYHGLNFFYDRLVPGGVIMIHDYNSSQYPGVKRAVRRFSRERGVYVMPLMDLHGTAVLQK